ncbi:MAG: hypothetical protein PHY48_11015 [Candidatus Cloacimonetes bacterium]|nr:hypothetical protein [Candidatus Cloacimonadota bacterium]
MDKQAFEAAKQEIAKGLSGFVSSSSKESIELVRKNTIHFMERMEWIDEMMLSGKMNDKEAKEKFILNKHAFESMALAEKHITKANTKKLLAALATKLIKIAVSEGLKMLLLALL